MTKDFMDEIDLLLQGLVKHHYDCDWLKCDRPRVEKCNPDDYFLIMARPEGVDTLFMTGEFVKYSNVNWCFSAIMQGRSKETYWFYDGKKQELRQVGRAYALRVIKNVSDWLPSNYCSRCEEYERERIRTMSEEPHEPTLNEWVRDTGFYIIGRAVF